MKLGIHKTNSDHLYRVKKKCSQMNNEIHASWLLKHSYSDQWRKEYSIERHVFKRIKNYWHMYFEFEVENTKAFATAITFVQKNNSLRQYIMWVSYVHLSLWTKIATSRQFQLLPLVSLNLFLDITVDF